MNLELSKNFAHLEAQWREKVFKTLTSKDDFNRSKIESFLRNEDADPSDKLTILSSIRINEKSARKYWNAVNAQPLEDEAYPYTKTAENFQKTLASVKREGEER